MAGKRKKIDISSISRDSIKEMAERYALDYEHYTMAELAQIYGLTEYYFKKAISRAIIECIVSFQIAEKIRDKSIANQKRHSKGNAQASMYYKVVFNERFEYFKAHCYDPEKAPIIAKNFFHSSIGVMAISLGLSPRETFYYILRGACYNFTENEYSQFTQKIRKDFSGDKNLEIKLQKINGLRKTYTELKAMLELAEYQLASLDDNISSEDEEYTNKKELEDKISKIKNLILELRNRPE